MIKKIFLALIAIVSMTATVSAADEYAHDASVLPKAAQTILSNNFKAKVTVVKIEKDFGKVSEYEAILSDGTEVSFDRNGNWKNIEVSANSSVPSFFVPKEISEFIKKEQPKQKVIGIEKKRNGYEVELTNGVDMKFNSQGQFLKYD